MKKTNFSLLFAFPKHEEGGSRSSHLLVKSFTTTIARGNRADLIASIDWTRHASNKYVIVNPFSPKDTLYLSEREFKDLTKTAMANQLELEVLATPSDNEATLGASKSASPSDKSHKFPPALHVLTKRRTPSALWNWVSGLRSSYTNKKGHGALSGDEDTGVYLHDGNVVDLFMRWGLTLMHWSGLTKYRRRSWMVTALAVSLRKPLSRDKTARMVILRLKITLICVQKYLAGSPLKSTQNLGMRMRLQAGLPVWLPLKLRHQVRVKNLVWVRILVSLLSSYRAISGPHPDSDASSIRAEPFNLMENQDLVAEFTRFSDFFWAWVFPGEQDVNALSLIREFASKPWYASLRAGPNAPMAILDAVPSALAWYRTSLCPPCGRWTDDSKYIPVPSFEHLIEMFNMLEMGTLRDRMFTVAKMASRLSRWAKMPLELGKIGVKLEPAGKVRLFAIVDYWTQAVSKPIHLYLFSLLKKIPEIDGTFDQEGIVKKWADKKPEVAYSFDLKSATDMIPAEIYLILLRPILGSLADKWLGILKQRGYLIPKDAPVKHPLGHKHLVYTRGQPMGALGSWAALAIAHHALVQFAAMRVNMPLPAQDYAVLGDDIVLFNRQLAESYLSVCEDWGIPIGLPKSFVSDGSWESNNINDNKVARLKSHLVDSIPDVLFNFANQIVLNGVNISPMSLKQELSCNSLTKRILTVKSALRNGILPENKLSAVLRVVCTPITWHKSQPDLQRGILSIGLTKALGVVLNPWVDLISDKTSLMIGYAAVWKPRAGILSDLVNLVSFSEDDSQKEAALERVVYSQRYPSLTEDLADGFYKAVSKMIRRKKTYNREQLPWLLRFVWLSGCDATRSWLINLLTNQLADQIEEVSWDIDEYWSVEGDVKARTRPIWLKRMAHDESLDLLPRLKWGAKWVSDRMQIYTDRIRIPNFRELTKELVLKANPRLLKEDPGVPIDDLIKSFILKFDAEGNIRVSKPKSGRHIDSKKGREVLLIETSSAFTKLMLKEFRRIWKDDSESSIRPGVSEQQ